MLNKKERTASLEKIVTGAAAPKPKTKKMITIASLVAILLLIAAYFLTPKLNVLAQDEEPLDKSIAVLPFTDMSQNKDQQYFADGVMEDILTQLQRMGELRVTSRTSVEQYRGSSKSVPVIGDELNVSYLLEGSVRKAGNQIMITAQLINTKNDSHIWSDNFTSEYTVEGLFDIQRKIAEGIVKELRLKISATEIQEITQAQTSSKEAYEHFIRGRLLYSQGNFASNEQSIDEYKLALKEDLKFAAAYGGIASSFLLRNWSYDLPEIWRDSASIYANRGIELDSNCAECYYALGFNTTTIDGQFSKSNLGLAYYDKALAINPNFELARSSAIIFYIWAGNYQKALDYLAMLNEDKNQASRLSWFHFFTNNPEKSRDYALAAMRIQKDRMAGGRLRDALTDTRDARGIRDVSKMIAEISSKESENQVGELLAFWIEEKYEDLVKYYEQENLDITLPFFHCITYSYYLTGKKGNRQRKSTKEFGQAPFQL
ncbi:MAG: hypothetical protein HC811_11970 [Flammeovirgaceae bacterium]|nr:hypothetical protein [Flammeovirgaceae bacterium]